MGEPDTGETEPTTAFTGPEPPPPGSIAYRRAILAICSTEKQEDYDRLMEPVWQWRGWRAGVEVMVELMGALAANTRPEWIDSFGRVRVDSQVVEMDDDAILRYAHKIAPWAHPELPRHEAFALSVREGEEMRELGRTLVPYWNEAATLLLGAESLAPARAVFKRWLNEHSDRRDKAASMGAVITHTHWRWRVMPSGDAWVDAFLSPAPGLRGSILYGPPDGWAAAPEAPAQRPGRGRKTRSKRCRECGQRHR